MAQLTRDQLQAAADRADQLSLSGGDVALQTSDTLPDDAPDDARGTVLDTAGSEQHGEVRSYTVSEVRTLLGWMGGDVPAQPAAVSRYQEMSKADLAEEAADRLGIAATKETAERLGSEMTRMTKEELIDRLTADDATRQ
jgi:hypothetical protein